MGWARLYIVQIPTHFCKLLPAYRNTVCYFVEWVYDCIRNVKGGLHCNYFVFK